MKKFFTYLLTFLTLTISIVQPTQALADNANTSANPNIQVQAKAAIAISPENGQILYEKNINEKLPIASMTKMISMAVVVDQIRANKLSFDDKITISNDLSELSQNTELSNVPLTAGQAYTVRDLFNASIIESANACVMALADKIAGNQANFVKLMNEKLNSWGIHDAHIVTTTGLNNEFISNWQLPNTSNDDENMMTAKDVAIVAMHIVNDYPEFMEAAKQPTATFADSYPMTNWNLMLPTLPVYTEGVDGLKTGTTDKAGACFAGSINKDGWRVVTVVMNVDNAEGNKTARFVQTRNLMTGIYNYYQPLTLKAGTSLEDFASININKAKEINQPIITKDKLTLIQPKNHTNYSFNLEDKKDLTAPLNKGTTVETLSVKTPLGFVGDAPRIELVTKNEVQKANIFTLMGRSIKSFFNKFI